MQRSIVSAEEVESIGEIDKTSTSEHFDKTLDLFHAIDRLAKDFARVLAFGSEIKPCLIKFL